MNGFENQLVRPLTARESVFIEFQTSQARHYSGLTRESTREHDQEFSHGCSQSKFGRLTGRTQPQIEGAQDWIVSRGD